MKCNSLIYLGGITALAVAMLASHADIDATTDALAATDSGAVSVTCTTPTAAAFTPAVAYTLSIAAPARGTVPTGASHSVSGSLSSGVSGDASVPSITTAAAGIGTKMYFYHTAPKMKIGGFQCSSSTSAGMGVIGDASDDPNFEISFQGVSATTYSSGAKVDQASSGSQTFVFGTGGTVGTSAVSDSDDSEGTTADGEVTFGPGATAAKGGFRIVNEVKYITVNPSVTETLTVSLMSM